MKEAVIRAENLGKRYRIGSPERYLALRDLLARGIAAPFQRLGLLRRADGRAPSSEAEPGFLWALKGVSFEVPRGEVLGVIGPNGAGKTTLLKILSRVTEPTEGRAELYGRVGSLLEVGTGFHPELTGRENIYLNGAILGMRKREIDRKFDGIVAFAEVETFIDTPVKHYSSGMQTRLAFAVAAHLEPEIVLLDEVLAVGDLAFQKKSEAKMREVASTGRTVLFVSHNLTAISMVCQKAMYVRSGQIAAYGPTADVIAQYRSTEGTRSAEVNWSFEEAPGKASVKLRAVRACNQNGEVCSELDTDASVVLEMRFWVLHRTTLVPVFHLYNQNGVLLFGTHDSNPEVWQKAYEPGCYQSRCTVPGSLLQDGRYYVTAILHKNPNIPIVPEILMQEVISFQVRDSSSGRGGFAREWIGLIRPVLPWSHRSIGDLTEGTTDTQ